MIKRTLFFSNPTHIYKRNEQLCFSVNRKTETDNEKDVITVPIEDIGVVVLDNKQITLSHAVMDALLQNNAAIITCNDQHMPSGMFLNLNGHHTQTEKFKAQLEASEPLKKQLWQQTVSAKLKNQGRLLKQLAASSALRAPSREGEGNKNNRAKRLEDAAEWLLSFSREVKSGDGDNHEARGAAIYWQNIFSGCLPPSGGGKGEVEFRRERFGSPPNNLLNYGYSILRGVVARALVASGALPTLGIFHRNKYNAYCLADDIMEPYRPYVDKIVYRIITSGEDWNELTPNIKKYFLEIPATDILIDDEQSPLMVGLQRTTASLMRCFEGQTRKIAFPEIK
ncbi:MAG: type II CRISPR-associated endonuclease Cas1 [Chitinophagales bacterium]|nr:type II CRISPR-associated endonuclease Cas1 [Chitinophagales bacterium]